MSEVRATSWHEGEIAIQRHAGVAELMAPVRGQVIRPYLMAQHRDFYPQLPFVLAGTVDPDGDAWATMLCGEPGFLQCPTSDMMRVTAIADPSDPASRGLCGGAAIGLLGIELPTRRRNRLNGKIVAAGATGFDVHVEESYGNCPQYIRQREAAFVRDPMAPGSAAITCMDQVCARGAEIVEAVETLFIASYLDDEDAGRHVDVSHKGGPPGFVKIAADGSLLMPDFAGNLYFNTLGNIFLNPRCGVAFIDFETGDVLQISGDGEILFDGPEVSNFRGADRVLRITPRRIVLREAALPLRWASPVGGISPTTRLPGTWAEAAARQKAIEMSRTWRVFRVAKVTEESSVIRSLVLEPTDDMGIMPHLAGQHLPIRVMLPGTGKAEVRTYTLSSSPADGVYRISVKRDGAVSGHLHGLEVGSPVEVRGPAGSFTLGQDVRRPAVMLGAGVGITPFMAMVREIVHQNRETLQKRAAWLIQVARSKPERAFERECLELVRSGDGPVAYTRVLTNISGAESSDYDVSGRIGADLLRQVPPSALRNMDFYLCGPAGFTQGFYDELRDLGVRDANIFSEAFGPAALNRRRGPLDPVKPLAAPALDAVEVSFAQSGLRTIWTPSQGSLLELAEAAGLSPVSSCRGGSCGTCRTRVVSGATTYHQPPATDVMEGEALICCAVPSNRTGGKLVLDL